LRPGYPISVNELHDFEPFFIMGCGRSGNTLLRSMLIAGEEVVIPPESYVWPRVIRKFVTYKHLPWDELCSIIIGEFEAYREFYTWNCNLATVHLEARSLAHNKRSLAGILDVLYRGYTTQTGQSGLRWGDKTPINTIYSNKIYKLFPRAHYIHIIRDPRDVVCSYLEAAKKNEYISVKNIEEAAIFWKASVNSMIELKKNNKSAKVIEIKYEELVSNPVDTLKAICEFLNINYLDALLEFWKKVDKLGDVNYHQHHANISSSINTKSMGKWKNILTEVDCEKLSELIGPLANSYGYDV
ncbi:MAG: sulfotransferase, partial [Emcibacteraceae bacterium]|nr:sulfotransferase [Emcibacteraceae bacterium]